MAEESIYDHYLRLAKQWSESTDEVQKDAVKNGQLAILIGAKQIEIAINNLKLLMQRTS